jgi:hypothetical protein
MSKTAQTTEPRTTYTPPSTYLYHPAPLKETADTPEWHSITIGKGLGLYHHADTTQQHRQRGHGFSGITHDVTRRPYHTSEEHRYSPLSTLPLLRAASEVLY